MTTTSVIYRVKDVKAYSQLEGRDWWYVRFDDPARSYSWQPTAYLGDIPPSTKARMSDMKKRWLSRQLNKYRLLILVLWLGALAGAAVTGYLMIQHWEHVRADPQAWKALYTLTLPVWSWSAICVATSLVLAATALRVQSKTDNFFRKRNRSFKSSGVLKRAAGGEPPKPTRMQPLRQCKQG
ncbi:hypothetical protein BESB_058640 [Besnoitia besnoiti]|uniref:Transmembrane protein n=1 Tax=Besnoitia besnoiti TaxID=94643 RepID=A0A2A9MHB3_BESBE|nr:hypothetical protein BESB_058640 [Besnoitia besnoiti]PFH34977.1 hypothetical protein BESB_058640 [Besnoitia besnoiti]